MLLLWNKNKMEWNKKWLKWWERVFGSGNDGEWIHFDFAILYTDIFNNSYL